MQNLNSINDVWNDGEVPWDFPENKVIFQRNEKKKTINTNSEKLWILIEELKLREKIYNSDMEKSLIPDNKKNTNQ